MQRKSLSRQVSQDVCMFLQPRQPPSKSFEFLVCMPSYLILSLVRDSKSIVDASFEHMAGKRRAR